MIDVMHIKNCLRENQLVRFFLLPIIRLKQKKEFKNYKNSKLSESIKKYRNIHEGKKCFIIGNGPSLEINDLERIGQNPNIISIASNSIYKIFEKTEWRPNYYVAVDPRYISMNSMEIHEKLNGTIKFIGSRGNYPYDEEKIERIFEYNKFKVNKWNDKSAHINQTVDEYFSIGYTVTFTAIQLAIYMGFSKIYLIGIDYSYPVKMNSKHHIIRDDSINRTHFYSDSKIEDKYNIFNYEGSLHAYKVAREFAENNHIDIINCTRGGKLGVFERKNLEDVLAKNEN